MANIKVELLSVEKPNPKVAPSYAHRKAVEEKIKASINTVDDAQSVSDIAAFSGFYHHSQFSALCKQLFGECPSEPMNRFSGRFEKLRCH